MPAQDRNRRQFDGELKSIFDYLRLHHDLCHPDLVLCVTGLFMLLEVTWRNTKSVQLVELFKTYALGLWV